MGLHRPLFSTFNLLFVHYCIVVALFPKSMHGFNDGERGIVTLRVPEQALVASAHYSQ